MTARIRGWRRSLRARAVPHRWSSPALGDPFGKHGHHRERFATVSTEDLLGGGKLAVVNERDLAARRTELGRDDDRILGSTNRAVPYLDVPGGSRHAGVAITESETVHEVGLPFAARELAALLEPVSARGLYPYRTRSPHHPGVHRAARTVR